MKGLIVSREVRLKLTDGRFYFYKIGSCNLALWKCLPDKKSYHGLLTLEVQIFFLFPC